MARYLVFWRMNLAAPWPTDPSKGLELNEMMWMAIDSFKQEGLLEDFGFFPDGTSGYAIGKGDSTDVFSRLSMFIPYMLSEVHEIIPYEKSKETLRALLKTQIAQARKGD